MMSKMRKGRRCMKVIFIVGAPGSGKSFVAEAIATRLSIPRIVRTDTVREIMRACIQRNDITETLHRSAILACELAPEGEDANIWGFMQQAKDLVPGIEAALKQAKKEGKDLIIEGIHLLPNLIKIPDGIDFKHICLIVESEEQHKAQILAQGQDRSSYKIDNFFKAHCFQDFLLKQSESTMVKIVNNDNSSNMMDVIIDAVLGENTIL